MLMAKKLKSEISHIKRFGVSSNFAERVIKRFFEDNRISLPKYVNPSSQKILVARTWQCNLTDLTHLINITLEEYTNGKR
jgi:hypothetical protein